MVICKHCQAELPAHIRFCGRCGNSIAKETHTPTVIEVLGDQKGTPPQWAEKGDPTKFLSTDEELPTLPGEQAVAGVPTVLFPVDVQQDQQQQDMQGAHASFYASLVEAGPDGRPEDVSAKAENIAAGLAFGAINLSPSQLMSEAPAVQPEDAGFGQHGAHHQPQVRHGAHHQPQIQHGAHHQPQVQHGAHHQPQIQHGVHHQAQGAHGVAHQAQGAHGVAHQAPGAHGVAHQAQGAHGVAHHGQHLRHIRVMKGCRPSCMTVIVSAGVALVVTASLLLLFLYILPGGAQPTLNIPTSISAGEIITAQGSNFSPGQHILITIDTQQKTQKDESVSLARANLLDSVRVLTQQQQQGIPLTVKSDGTFTTTLQADPFWNVGSQHTLYISRQDGSLLVKKQFTIKAGSPQLALCSVSASSAAITLGPVVAGQSASISTPFKLCTRGSGQVDWSSSWDMKQAPWLLLLKSGHVQAPQALLLQFSASAASLKVGNYTTTVTFSSLKSSLKITLKVTLIVQDKNTCIQSGTTNLNLTSIPGQGSPTQQSVTISNCGESGDWTAVSTTDDGASWLSVNPGNGTLQKGASQDITVGATAANLVVGTYTGHVAFGSGSNAAHIDVTFVVTSTPQVKPCLAVNTGQLNFTANAQGSDPAAQGVTISNGCGAGSWSASIDQSWLGLSAVSGNIDANSGINLNVQASIANLGAGTYTGHVTFYPGTATVTVILNVQPVPCISVLRSPPNISVMEGNTSANARAVIYFGNGASCVAGAWSAQSDVPWITFVTPSSGSLNAGATSEVYLNINENAVGTGSFSGHITFSPGSGSSVATINLTVYQRLCISASPTSLSFTGFIGRPSPPAQTFTVTNCANAGTLSISSITTNDGANWLHATGGGSLGVGGNRTLSVTVSPGSNAGTYTGHIYITITGSDGGTTYIWVDVTYNVYYVIT